MDLWSDLSDREYQILDIVSKDINMIQLLYNLPKEKLERFLKYCTDHCNSYVFIRSLDKPKINMNLTLLINQYTKLYNRKHNVMIYLIGETHTNSGECKNSLETFLDDLPNYPYLIDVFSELPRYVLKDNYTMSSKNLQYMNQYHRDSKDLYNIRTHESDLRKLMPIHPLHFEVYNGLGMQGYKVPEKFIKEGLPPITDTIKNRIYKQISKIYDPNYKRIIEEILDENINHLNGLRKKITKTGKYTLDEIVSAMTLIDINNSKSLIDSYIIARMHRNFEKKGDNKNNCSTRPRNIIYIAGYAHTKVVENYLKKLDYEVLIDRFSNEQCSNTNDNLPLFFRPI